MSLAFLFDRESIWYSIVPMSAGPSDEGPAAASSAACSAEMEPVLARLRAVEAGIAEEVRRLEEGGQHRV